MIFHGTANFGLGWYPLGEAMLPIVVLTAAVWGAALVIITVYGPAKLAYVRSTAIAGYPGEPAVAASGEGRGGATGTHR